MLPIAIVDLSLGPTDRCYPRRAAVGSNRHPVRAAPTANYGGVFTRKKIPAEAGTLKKCGNHLLSPCDYHRPCGLNFRVRNGNGCIPTRNVTARRIVPAQPQPSSPIFCENLPRFEPSVRRLRDPHELRGANGLEHAPRSLCGYSIRRSNQFKLDRLWLHGELDVRRKLVLGGH